MMCAGTQVYIHGPDSSMYTGTLCSWLTGAALPSFQYICAHTLPVYSVKVGIKRPYSRTYTTSVGTLRALGI